METIKDYPTINSIRLDFPFIYAEFENGEKRKYDIKYLIDFREEYKVLLNANLFNQAEVTFGGRIIEWNDYIDTTEVEIYDNGGVL